MRVREAARWGAGPATTFQPMSWAVVQQDGASSPVGGLGPVKGPDMALPGSQQLAPFLFGLLLFLFLVGLGIALLLRSRPARRPGRTGPPPVPLPPPAAVTPLAGPALPTPPPPPSLPAVPLVPPAAADPALIVPPPSGLESLRRISGPNLTRIPPQR